MRGIRNKLIPMIRMKHNAGPMKDRRLPRSGVRNLQREWVDETVIDNDDNERVNDCWD